MRPARAAHATVIDFDELNTEGAFLNLSDISPYAGLNWSMDWYAGDTGIDGYAGAAHSGVARFNAPGSARRSFSGL